VESVIGNRVGALLGVTLEILGAPFFAVGKSLHDIVDGEVTEGIRGCRASCYGRV